MNNPLFCFSWADTPSANVGSNGMRQSLRAMGFEELIENALRNPQNVELISEIMTSEFQVHQKTITITNDDSLDEFLTEDELIRIRDLDMAIDFITNFGKLIIKLNYDGLSFVDSIKSMQALKLINEICTNLVEVKLPSNWSASLTKPLENVRKAAVMGDISEKLDLNAIYPNVEELLWYRVSGSSLILQNLPHLKKLVYSFTGKLDTVIYYFLMKNRQIEEFQSRVFLPRSTLENVCKALPNLKVLSSYMSSHSKPIISQLFPSRSIN